jgi:hypothetical protein
MINWYTGDAPFVLAFSLYVIGSMCWGFEAWRRGLWFLVAHQGMFLISNLNGLLRLL